MSLIQAAACTAGMGLAILSLGCADNPRPEEDGEPSSYEVELRTTPRDSPAPKKIGVMVESVDDALAIMAAGDTLVVVYAPGTKPCLDHLIVSGWTVLPDQEEIDVVSWLPPSCNLDRVDHYLVEFRTIATREDISFYFPAEYHEDLGVRIWAVTEGDTAGTPSAWGLIYGGEPSWTGITFDESPCVE